MVSTDRLGDERIEDPHQHTARETDLNAESAGSRSGGLAASVRPGIHDTGENHQEDSSEQEQSAALGRNQVVQQDSYNQGQADPDGECDGKAGNVNGSHKQ